MLHQAVHIVAIGLETVNIKPGVSKQMTVSAGHQISFFPSVLALTVRWI
jgi:hypothetical protein